jgi:hypothetical protein
MSTEQESINDIFTQLYKDWISAIQQRDFSWFEKHMSEDFSCSAHPIPGMSMTKEQLIAGERMIDSLKLHTLEVHAHSVKRVVVATWVAKIEEQIFNPRCHEVFGPEFPSPEAFAALVKDKTMVYMDGWRRSGDIWQCFSHHMVGPAD